MLTEKQKNLLKRWMRLINDISNEIDYQYEYHNNLEFDNLVTELLVKSDNNLDNIYYSIKAKLKEDELHENS
jgi:DNA-binding PadR family transcriptional regulator